jgi:glucose/arabinose dehydrogenase
VEVKAGVWYGWPDFSGGEPLTSDRFKPPGKRRPEFLLSAHPNLPPKPIARFGVHSSDNGLDIAPEGEFGHAGQAFVALFGDEAPATGKVLHPVGFKVVRVQLEHGIIEEFAVNKGRKNGPASKIGGGGLERPVAVRFHPDGSALYVVDFGVMTHTKERAVPRERTGVIWRIARDGGVVR